MDIMISIVVDVTRRCQRPLRASNGQGVLGRTPCVWSLQTTTAAATLMLDLSGIYVLNKSWYSTEYVMNE